MMPNVLGSIEAKLSTRGRAYHLETKGVRVLGAVRSPLISNLILFKEDVRAPNRSAPAADLQICAALPDR